ncbi:hypothetical protein M8C21_025064, partial [Ambrosia artemisiifolia]
LSGLTGTDYSEIAIDLAQSLAEHDGFASINSNVLNGNYNRLMCEEFASNRWDEENKIRITLRANMVLLHYYGIDESC